MGLNKRKVIGALSAICIGGGGMLYLYVEQLDDEHEALVADQVEVVKAARQLAGGIPLTKDRITTEKVPRKFLPPNPLLESELNIYLGTPLAVNVDEGAMILTSDFSVGSVGGLNIPAIASPLVIKTAHMTLEAERPADAGQAALAAVQTAGGYIVASDTHVTKHMQKFSMTARIPAAEFEDVLFEFNELGNTVERRVRGAGVTADVQRLERKLGNQDFLIEGLRNAKPKPRAVKEKSIEIIAGDRRDQIVERETTTYDRGDSDQKLVEAEHEFEELKAELDQLQADTALSTIDLTITLPPREAAAPPPELSKSELVMQDFEASGEAVLRGLFGAIRLFAKMLPVLIFVGPFAIGFAVWRRRRQRLEGAAK